MSENCRFISHLLSEERCEEGWRIYSTSLWAQKDSEDDNFSHPLSHTHTHPFCELYWKLPRLSLLPLP